MNPPRDFTPIIPQISFSNLSQISEAYRRFGITPASNHLIIVKILISPASNTTPSAIEQHLRNNVQGTPVPFTDEALQSGLTDQAKVRKYYKLNSVGWLDGVADEALRRREAEMLVLGGMALRSL